LTHPIAKLTDHKLVEALLEYAPGQGKDALRADFTRSVYRYCAALQQIPDGRGEARLLDIGARLYTATIYVNLLNCREAALATKWQTSYTDEALLGRIPNGEHITLQHFDAEIERFPYADETFDVIVCTEVLEHLAIDPMHMLCEMGRTCRQGGLLIMTTPNAASFDALTKVMAGNHPYSWAPYSGESTDRHNREYTIKELERAVTAAGFHVRHSATLSAQPFGMNQKLLAGWYSIPDLVRGKAGLDLDRMRATSLVVGQKAGPASDQYPGWLYYDPRRGH
jgi:SAM-dependent methyltransferase